MRAGLAVLLILLSVLMPLQTASGEGITVTVTIEAAVSQAAGVTLRKRPDQRGRPGVTLTYRFRLQNTGNGTDRFALAAISSRGWSVAVPGGALTDVLAPAPGGRSRATVDVEVTIPLLETIGAEDMLTLTATSEFDPGVSAQAAVTSTVVERGVIKNR